MLLMLLRTALIYFFVLIVMRFMGKRQLGELQASEFVTTMIISNIASISIEEHNVPLLLSIIPVVVIAAFEVLFSAVTVKKRAVEKFVEGSPQIVIKNGNIIQKTLDDLRYSVDDLLAALREKDVFDPSCVALAFIEANGKLSAYAVQNSPKVNNEQPPVAVIVEGSVIEASLKKTNNTSDWLQDQLQKNKLTQKDVLLMLIYQDGHTQIMQREANR